MSNAFNEYDNSAPCKNCPDRHRACHDNCEKFEEYKKRRAEIFAKRMEYAASKRRLYTGKRGYNGMMRAFSNAKYERKKK